MSYSENKFTRIRFSFVCDLLFSEHIRLVALSCCLPQITEQKDNCVRYV